MNQDKTSRDWARKMIQATGLRATTARVETLLVLRDAAGPLTHAEVFGRLAGHPVDKATVFRNLNDMAAANLLRRSEFGDHAWRFEISAGKEHVSHPHFMCVDCGVIKCLEEVELAKLRLLASQQFGKITEVLIRGHCHECV